MTRGTGIHGHTVLGDTVAGMIRGMDTTTLTGDLTITTADGTADGIHTGITITISREAPS